MIARLLALVDPRYRFRSSVTRLFVTRGYALLHPRETYREKVR